MSYKQFLMGRHSSFQEAESDASPLDYMQLRNRDALRDWQLRAARVAAATRVQAAPLGTPALRPTLTPAARVAAAAPVARAAAAAPVARAAAASPAARATKEAPRANPSLSAAFMLQVAPELQGP